MPLAIVVNQNTKDIQSLDNLKNKLVAVNKGSYLHEWLVVNHPEIHLKLMTSNDASLKAVSFSEVDAYIGNIAVATYIIKVNYLSNLKIVSRVENMDTNVSIAILKENIILQNIIEKTLKHISMRERQVIVNKWFDKSTIPTKKLQLTKDEKSWITSHPEIKVGIDTAWEPFDFINEKGNHDGMSADYLALISKKSGLHFVIEKHLKWSDVLSSAKNNELDMISALAPSKKRSSFLNFTDAYMQYAFVLATADLNRLVYDISDFKGKKIGVIESYITEDILKNKYKDIEVVKYPDMKALLKGVVSHEVDAIFDNAVSLAYHIKQQGYSHIKMVTIGEHKRTITMGVTKDNSMLLQILNKSLKSISSQEHKVIRDRWVSLEYEKATVDYILVYQILGLFSFFILGTWFWYRKLSQEVEKRKQSEAQINMLIDTIPLNVIVSGYDGSVLRVNNFALKTFDILAENISQYNVMEFYVDIADRENIIRTIKEEGKLQDRIVKVKRLDETQMNVMLSIMPIVYDSKQALLSIMLDLTERIEMEESLTQAKIVADKANKSKSEFLANMSHEIRTPMNAIMGFTELLSEQLEKPRLKTYTDIIQSAGNTLLLLINDILDLSKIEAGKLEINKKSVNIYDVVEEISSIFSITVGSKGLSILMDVDKNIPNSLLLDDIRLRQVLVNIVGNAVKFTEEGYIKISVYTTNVSNHLSKLDLTISVEDTGIGIVPEERERIFNSFEQQEGQDNRKFGGTGLGLSISKSLVEMMDGDIVVQSTEQQGTTFFVFLYGVDISSTEVEKIDYHDDFSYRETCFDPAQILVVDDIEDNRELIIQNFKNTDIEIITANDGYEAIEQYKKETPALILMDIRMPNMDGYEAASQIKQLSDVPIVALTASVMKDEYEQAKSENFDAYLRKPISREKLFLTLRKFLKYKNVDSTSTEKVATLDKKTLNGVHMIMNRIQNRIMPLHAKAIQSNSMEHIHLFAEELERLTLKEKNEVFVSYVTRLKEAIDTFDIYSMQSMLKEFTQLKA